MKLKKVLRKKSFRTSWEKLMLNFQLTNVRLNEHLKRFFADHGITYQQYNVLQVIAQSKKGKVNSLYIKSRIVEKDADVSRLLSRLVVRGLVIKTPKPTDKRQSLIELSEEGLALMESIEADIHLLDRFFYNLSRKEVKQLNGMLDRIRARNK